MRRGRARFGFRWSPLAVAALLLLVILDREGIGSAALLAALVHECGHLLAVRLLSLSRCEMRLDFLGARLRTEGRLLSYGEEWLLAAAGPLFSLSASAVAGLFLSHSYFLYVFAASSLLLGLFNLLPVRTLDGGRMLELLLERCFGTRVAVATLAVTSFASLFLLWALAVYLLLRVGDGLSLLCFSMGLFTRFLRGEEL